MSVLQSETIGKLAEALAKAQGLFPVAAQNGKNPHFRSKFARQQDLIDATKKILMDYGLSVTQHPSVDQGNLCITTILAHASGEWIRSTLAFPAPNDIQKLGSAISYMTRYCYRHILRISAGDDGEDDGNSLVKSPNVPVKNSQPSPPQIAPPPKTLGNPNRFAITNEDDHLKLTQLLIKSGAKVENIQGIMHKLNGLTWDDIFKFLQSKKG